MPPKKRKSDNAKADGGGDTDDEKQTKKSRRVEDAKAAAKADALKFDLEWSTFGKALEKSTIEPLLCLSSKTEPGCTKVAGFDIDHTLIVTKSGRAFPTSKENYIIEIII